MKNFNTRAALMGAGLNDERSMMNKFCKNLKTAGLSTLVSLTIAGTASAQTLSQAPLEATILAEPNIMLNLDDSGSMSSITYDTGYDRNATYEAWNINTGGLGPPYYPNNLPHGNLGRCSGDSRYIEGTLGFNTKCLRLPDPLTGSGAGDTLYALNYLQYLFQTYAFPGTPDYQDLRSVIPDDYRMNVLREAANRLVSSRDGIRWCISDLNSPGFPQQQCSNNAAAAQAVINNTFQGGGTELAETYYEITRYFRGQLSAPSPVQYRCQKNFAVIVTDGYPTGDTSFPSGVDRADFGLDPIDTGTGLVNTSLPNWDGLAPTTTSADFNNNIVPQYSDGFGPSGSSSSEGYSLYLDDLALFANEIDFFRSGNDNAGAPWGDATDPDDDSDFSHQNLKTYTIGFGIDNQMLEDAATYGDGLSFSSGNATQLTSALNAILADVVGLVGSSAASTATTAFLSTGNQVFQVKYDTNDWSGSLLSYTIDSDPASATFGQLSTPIWSTDDNFAEDELGNSPDRNILTSNTNSDEPVVMEWANLSTTQRAQLDDDPGKLSYILGDQSEERINGGSRRNRSKLLGDVVHSQPVYIANQDYGYADASYQTFLESSLVQNREPIVYVGANDGFMHGFNAAASSDGGSESFAFAPRAVYPLYNDFDSPAYLHHYFVDGRSVGLDVQLGDGDDAEWATVLISAMGAGAEGLFALDITDPSRYSDVESNAEEIYLWEISNSYPLEAGEGSASSNVALSATATQSSNFDGSDGHADEAIDGNNDGNYTNGSVTHTQTESEAWLELELDELALVEQIEIYNRTDANPERLSNFSVFVSKEPFESENLVTTQNQAGVTEYYFSGNAAAVTTIDVDNLLTRYVRVQLHDTNALSVAELIVNGLDTEATYEQMGHITDRPSVIRVGTSGSPETYQWMVITGNGIHSTDGDAVFFMIDLDDGSKVDEIVLDDTGDNGIVSNTAVDIDGDDLVDRVYLSDIKGNIWRLDWDDSSDTFVSEYSNGGDPVPFFTATDSTLGTGQPITAAVEVTRFPGESGSLMIHFGTGKFYDIEDREIDTTYEPVRTFYGVVDRGDSTGGSYTAMTKSYLQEQTITENTGGDLRTVSSNTVDYSSAFGWYIDLPTGGERVIYEAIAIKDRILFTTIVPTDPSVVDPCIPSVSGWLMEVDAFNGGSPETVVFDTNNDGNFDDSDVVALTDGSTVQAAGIQPSTGAPLPPSIIRVEPGGGEDGTLKGIVSDSSGNLAEFVHQAPRSRTSWRRLN